MLVWMDFMDRVSRERGVGSRPGNWVSPMRGADLKGATAVNRTEGEIGGGQGLLQWVWEEWIAGNEERGVEVKIEIVRHRERISGQKANHPKHGGELNPVEVLMTG
jgi:hypothetical protein